VQEAAQLLDVIAGPDNRDATTRESEPNSEYETAATNPSVTGTNIGIVEELEDGDSRVLEEFHDGIEKLADDGATVKRVSLESISRALAAYYIIAMAEASSNLARFDGVRYGLSGGYDGDWNEVYSKSRNSGFGEEVKRRIILGTFALSEGYQDKYYGQAQDARRWIKQDFERVFSEVDVLATPTMPVIAPEMGERIDDPMELYLMDANTVPVNLANLPAISIPVGTVDNLPVGCQLIGKAFGETTLLQLGRALEDRLA
jgi:aspartyl-tRNA(Asn)/glutamyl-tRNA(Gln) amidotransferase subunit A